MPQIGSFMRDKTGFAGRIQTFLGSHEIVIVPAETSNSDNAPDYRIHRDDEEGPEIGAGWKRTGERAGDYVALLIDDPLLPQPLRANLFRDGSDGGIWSLHWNRSGSSSPPSPSDLRLRAQRLPVVRLSRPVIWTLGGAGMLAIGLALGYALQNSTQKGAVQAAQDTDTRPSADGLAALPSDYSAVPKLGPPLPGDLGKPILDAQKEGRAGPVSGIGDRRGDQEIEAARTSKLFAQVEAHDVQTTQTMPVQAASGTRASPTATDQQAGNRAFLAGQPDRATLSPDRIAPPASPYLLQAGTVVAGALNTKISSDLPGQIVGHVTQNVYDSSTGRYLLIPQGSTLFGAYNSGISFGQQRTQIIWTRLIYPNGESLVLEKLPGGDAIGQSGLSDEVNNHWGQLFRAALVTTLLSVGSEAGTSWNENNLMQAIRSGASNGFSMVGNRLIDRSLNVQPTLTDRPGLPFTLILNHDLVLKPWKEKETHP